MNHRRRQQDLDTIVWCSHATDPDRRPQCLLTATVRFGTVTLCRACAGQRSTVGKGRTGIPLPPSPAVDLPSWIAVALLEAAAAQRTLTAAVSRARQAGLSWSIIGAQLGVTRQAAQQRFTRVSTTQPPVGLDPRPAPRPSSRRRR